MQALSRAWKITASGHLSKRFKFPSHTKAAQFVARVAPIADEMNHHPVVLIRYRFATFDLKTNDINPPEGALSELDEILAERIDLEYERKDGPAATEGKKLIVPLVLTRNLQGVDKIHHLHHPISVIDSVPNSQLDTLANSIRTIRRLNSMADHQQWWHWALVYTQLRISTASVIDDPEHKLGRRHSPSVELVAEDVTAVIDSLKFSQLEALEHDLQVVNSTHNQQYWDHILYLVQSRAAYLKLNHIFNGLKPTPLDQFDLQPENYHYNPIEQVKSNLPENELLFDSGTADPQYAARAVIGQAPNYQDKRAVVHNQPWLNSSVKGYRFTIYYRDIHGSDMPDFDIKRQNDGTSHLVFSAPNYPDLTFNILDKPWDKSKYADIKFVNTFNRGTVQLQFGFK